MTGQLKQLHEDVEYYVQDDYVCQSGIAESNKFPGKHSAKVMTWKFHVS